MSLSPRVRILAAAAVLAVLALAGGLLLLGRGQSASSAAVKTIKPLHPVKTHAAAPKAKPKTTAKKVAATVSAKPKRKPAAVVDGMPRALATALRAHKVVVVSLYTPGAGVDAMATAEAKHGAALAHAGFVSFDVADEKIVSPLTALLTGAPTPADRVLDGPAVLVFQRPSSLFVRLNGFADRDTVAQAAANATMLAR